MSGETLKKLQDFDRVERAAFGDALAGIDEAGRGPLAGPVVAAAVVFRRSFQGADLRSLEDLNDSKLVTPKRREILFRQIARFALIGIGMASEMEIDALNIFQATLVAMRKAVLSLTLTPSVILIDGKHMKLDLPIPQKSVIGGDRRSASIAAASIIAKVVRDAWMQRLDTQYPGYHFARHKGYGTRAHMESLERLGPSPVHRRSFAPVMAAGGARV